MDHETALAESGKLVAPSRHHDIPGPSSHDDDKSNDMARRGGRQFAMQTGCRRDAGHGSPFPPSSSLPVYSFTCILNCTKKQRPFFSSSLAASSMHVFLWVTNAPPPRTKRRRSGLWGIRDTGRETGGGTWQEERGHKRDAQRGVPRMAVFIFLFTLDKAFPAVLSVHWGAATKTHKGTANRGVPYCGRSKQANPEAWVFYSDHADSVGSRTRSGKGSKQQAEGMWVLVWPREPVVVAWCWGRNGGHIVLLYMGYGSMRGGSIQQFPRGTKGPSCLSVVVESSVLLPLAGVVSLRGRVVLSYCCRIGVL